MIILYKTLIESFRRVLELGVTFHTRHFGVRCPYSGRWMNF